MDNNISKALTNLQDAISNHKAFVYYRKPNTQNLIEIIQKDNSLNYLENTNQKGFVFAPFDTKKKSIFFDLNNARKFEYQISATSFHKSKLRYKLNTEGENHIELVKKGIEYIKKNKTPKIVLSRKEVLNVEKLDLIKTFENLLHKYASAFVYIWNHPKVGLWLGASPEILLTTKGKQFTTMSLAGTQKYNGTIDVVWNEKEINEHQIVTDYIVDTISKLNIPFNVSDVNTIKAGELLHIQAKITGRLNHSNSVVELIDKLHPTPAICGLPKAKAKDFILKNEGYDRNYYTGFLGELNFDYDHRRHAKNKKNIENQAYQFNKTQSNIFVNLRCMQIKHKQVFIYVGGGITIDSNPKKEYLETIAKAETMKSVLY